MLFTRRYEAVAHLVTAADGAPQYYSNASGHRLESIEQALAIDKLTQQAWLGHPKLRILRNEVDFNNKVIPYAYIPQIDISKLKCDPLYSDHCYHGLLLCRPWTTICRITPVPGLSDRPVRLSLRNIAASCRQQIFSEMGSRSRDAAGST